MPNYEYRCTQCENQFEIWQEIGADAPPCPECQSEVKKVFHPIRTIYKGSGFYITDTRAEKSPNQGSSGSSTQSAATPEPAPATETKTEAAPSTPAAPKAG